jgi:hypothetical protein
MSDRTGVIEAPPPSFAYFPRAAHSMSVNANMKPYAAWWLWARLGGWDIPQSA